MIVVGRNIAQHIKEGFRAGTVFMLLRYGWFVHGYSAQACGDSPPHYFCCFFV